MCVRVTQEKEMDGCGVRVCRKSDSCIVRSSYRVRVGHKIMGGWSQHITVGGVSRQRNNPLELTPVKY